MDEACSTYGRGAYRVLVGKPEGKRQLATSRRRWEDNIKIHLPKAGWGIDWIDMAQDRDLSNTIMSFFPSKCEEFRD